MIESDLWSHLHTRYKPRKHCLTENINISNSNNRSSITLGICRRYFATHKKLGDNEKTKLTLGHQHHNHGRINSLSTCMSKWGRQKKTFLFEKPWKFINFLLTYLKNFAVWNFVMFGRFSTLCMKEFRAFPANIYLFKGNNKNTRKSCEICSKLTKTPERRHCRR